jgi:hypothetical protein
MVYNEHPYSLIILGVVARGTVVISCVLPWLAAIFLDYTSIYRISCRLLKVWTSIFSVGQKSNRLVGGAAQIPQEVINLIKPIILL